MKGKYLQFALGMVAGALLCGTTATAADYLTATISTQRFYLNGQPVQFEAYVIHGNNFVKLRDIGQAVDFGVTYDGTTNSVYSRMFLSIEKSSTFDGAAFFYILLCLNACS